MIKKIVEIEAKVDKAVEGVEKVSKKVDELKVKGVEATDKLTDGVKDIGKSAKKTEKDVGGIAKGFKGVGVAIKAAGIGLVIALLAKLKEMMDENQMVLDLFNTTFEAMGLMFNDFVNFLTDNFSVVTDIFENPIESVKALGQAILDNIITRFEGVLNLIPNLAKAVEELFSGNFSEAAKIATDAFGQIAFGVESVTDVVSDTADAIVSYTAKTIKGAKANVELQKAANKAAVANQGLIEQYDRQAEQLRQIRDDDTKGINERIEANDKLKLKLEEQKEKMLENANAILAAAQAQFDKNGNDENAIALQEAKNELAGVEAQIEGFMSEQMSNNVALRKEKLDLTLSQQEASTTLAIDEKRFNAEQIEDDLARLEALRLVLEEEKIIELERLQTKIDSYALDTQARADAEAEYAAKKVEIDQQLTENEKETSATRIEIGKQEKDARQKQLSGIGAALQQAAQMAGESTAAGKTLALASTAISTYQTAQAAYQSAFLPVPNVSSPALGAVFAAIAVAGGLMNMKKIMAVKTPSGTSGASMPSPSVPSAPRTPSFNMVGGSTGNQIAEIGKKPVKAFVVSGEVTTAQQLERNAVAEASI